MPRNFNFTADGEYLLVAHQASGDVVVFKRDIKSGKLQQTEYMTSINKPVYLFALR
jgi:6-phosphogluconolactonase